MDIKKGSTDRSIEILIVNSSTGVPVTGLVYNTAGLSMGYRREGGALTAITLATLASLTAAHSDGGFLEIASGYYRLDIPDAAVATGANRSLVYGAATDGIVIAEKIRLVNWDPEDTVRGGLTALPNASSGAAGGLPVSATGGLDLDSKLAATNEVTAARMGALTDWINGGRLDLLLDGLGTAIAALNDLSSAEAQTAAAAAITAATLATAANLAIVDGIVDSILVDTGTDIPASIAALPTDADVNAACDTAISDAALATASALATVDGNVDSILEDTGATLPAAIAALPTDADVNAACDTAISDAALATAAALAVVDTNVDSILVDTGTDIPAAIAVVDANVDSILEAVEAVNARLPADPADESALETAIATRAAAGDSMALTEAERAALIAALLATTVEDTETFIQLLRIIRSGVAGDTEGATDPASGDPITMLSRDGSKARITGVVDAAGNRTVSATDGS